MKHTQVNKKRACIFVGYTMVMGIAAVGFGGVYGEQAFLIVSGIGGIIWILLLANWVIIPDEADKRTEDERHGL